MAYHVTFIMQPPFNLLVPDLNSRCNMQNTRI